MMNSSLSGTFRFQEQEHNGPKYQFSSTKSRKSFSSRRGRDNKNPYADRGLDKFSALLADLEDKRKKIYTQVGSEDIYFVRFAYSNSNHCKPIVVKLKDKKKQEIVKHVKDNHVKNESAETLDNKYPIVSSATSDLKSVSEKTKKKRFIMGNNNNWSEPNTYLVVIVIFILLFLAVFGKSFTILCTSVGWYLVPAIRKGRSSLEKSRKKKEYTRKMSEIKVGGDGLTLSSSPTTRTMNSGPPRQRGHCDSW